MKKYIIGNLEKRNGLWSQMVGDITNGHRSMSRVYSKYKRDFKGKDFAPYRENAENVTLDQFNELFKDWSVEKIKES